MKLNLPLSDVGNEATLSEQPAYTAEVLVVSIGASAGGLESLRTLVQNKLVTLL
jgi:chemotaxis response regulator CheB